MANIDIDLVKPTVKITGVKKGKTYPAKKKPKCKASDALSGLDSCTVKQKKKGSKYKVTATATDKAGNVTVVKLTYKVKKPTSAEPSETGSPSPLAGSTGQFFVHKGDGLPRLEGAVDEPDERSPSLGSSYVRVQPSDEPTRPVPITRPGLFAPVPRDPSGRAGPTPWAASTSVWRRSSRGLFVPSRVVLDGRAENRGSSGRPALRPWRGDWVGRASLARRDLVQRLGCRRRATARRARARAVTTSALSRASASPTSDSTPRTSSSSTASGSRGQSGLRGSRCGTPTVLGRPPWCSAWRRTRTSCRSTSSPGSQRCTQGGQEPPQCREAIAWPRRTSGHPRSSRSCTSGPSTLSSPASCATHLCSISRDASSRRRTCSMSRPDWPSTTTVSVTRN